VSGIASSPSLQAGDAIMDHEMAKNKNRAILPERTSATVVPPIKGTFEDAVRAMLATPAPPKNLGRPKAKKKASKKR
jgi:hypothetical protein